MRNLRQWGRAASLALVVAGVLMIAACGDVRTQAEGGPLAGGAIGGSVKGTNAPVSAPAAIPLATSQTRQSGGVVASGGPAAPYDYAPTVMKVAGQYRMWWCSQLPSAHPGDQILYAVSSSVDGPFSAPGAPANEVFGNSAAGFDSLHTCDPSVIAVGGTYYLYYTGTSDAAGARNAIGVATSTDGVHWARANNGRPIVTSSGDVARANTYGVGQPAAVYLNGWYYLMFTDTTGQAAGPDGAGQFVLRSPDPAFGSEVQAVEPRGFTPVPGTSSPRLRSVLAGTTADLMWSDTLNAFALAQDTDAGTVITFWDMNFGYHPYQPVVIAGPTREGPGFVRRADGHAPLAGADPCGTVPLDVVRATGIGAGPLDLRHFGLDLNGLHGCANAVQAAAVLNGFAMPSPSRTEDLVVDGKLVEVERRSVAGALAEGVLSAPVSALVNLPVIARLDSGAVALAAPGRPVGLLLGGLLWTVGARTIAAANSSAVSQISTTQWDAYPHGGDLSGLRH
jgi:hypothetical protein